MAWVCVWLSYLEIVREPDQVWDARLALYLWAFQATGSVSCGPGVKLVLQNSRDRQALPGYWSKLVRCSSCREDDSNICCFTLPAWDFEGCANLCVQIPRLLEGWVLSILQASLRHSLERIKTCPTSRVSHRSETSGPYASPSNCPLQVRTLFASLEAH